VTVIFPAGTDEEEAAHFGAFCSTLRPEGLELRILHAQLLGPRTGSPGRRCPRPALVPLGPVVASLVAAPSSLRPAHTPTAARPLLPPG